MAEKKRVYKIIFFNEGRFYEIYAREVGQGNLFGFVEVAGLLFGEKTGVVVDPAEEKLQSEFAGVERTYIPMHAVVRIDVVPKRGASKIVPVDDKEAKVYRLPSPLYTPVKKDS